jgi:hypothetical protein
VVVAGGAVDGDPGADLDPGEGAGGGHGDDDADLGGAGPGAVGGRNAGQLQLKLYEPLTPKLVNVMVSPATLVRTARTAAAAARREG